MQFCSHCNFLTFSRLENVFSYIVDTLEAGEILPLKSSYVIGYSELSRKRLADQLDPLDIR